MSTDKKTLAQHPTPISSPLSIRELATVLVKHYGLTEGKYDLMVEFQIGVGPVGPGKDSVLPGAMIGVSRIGLISATQLGPNTIDAASITPPKKPRRKSAT